MIEKCTSNERNITWRLYLESASQFRASAVILKGKSPAAVGARPRRLRRRRRGRKRRSMGPELRLYTRCGEWSRCEPSSRINAGECISGGEEEEEEAREHLSVSSRTRTHIQAH